MKILIVFLVVLQFFFGNKVLSQCTLEFSGYILDMDTRQKIEGASIKIKELNRLTTSNDSGLFAFRGLCPGTYTVDITHTNCQPQQLHIHLKEDLHQDVELPHSANQLAEVVVKGRVVVIAATVVSELKGKALEATRGLSLGESLKQISGVNVLQTGNNIYKPVINGLHSSRVLILNNGIRQEGQQWGSEHAPEIDPFLASRLTVIKGSASIRYGGDAIGGVILIEPKALPYGVEGISGELNTGIFSNNRQGVVSAMIESSGKRLKSLAWRLQGTAKRGGNAHTPGYWLANSGVEELNMSATIGLQKEQKGLELFYSIFSTQLGIFTGSHIGNITDLTYAINASEPPDYIKNVGFTYKIERPYQSVRHQLVKLKAFNQTGKFSKLSLVGSFQENLRQEYDIVRTPRSNPQLELTLYTSALEIIWDHYKHKNLKGTIGLSGTYQNNMINYRYFVPNYQSYNLGAFVAEKYSVGDWLLEAGIRYDYKRMFEVTDNDPEPFNQFMGNVVLPGDPYGNRGFKGFSGNTGVNYKKGDWRFTLSGSTAWRSPQVNELFSNGLHHGAARIETGKSNLLPERSFGVQAGIQFNSQVLDLDISFYNKMISDFIYLKPTYPPQLTIRGAFPTFEYNQTDANLRGLDMQIGYLTAPHLKLMAKASLLRAFDKKAKDWLIQMPADRYEGGIEYLFNETNRLKQRYIKLNFSHVMQQTRVPESGNISITNSNGTVSLASDYTPPPKAYSLVGLETGAEMDLAHRRLSVILGVNNLFNVRYRDYMNAFRYFCDDMGRNITLRVKVPLIFKH